MTERETARETARAGCLRHPTLSVKSRMIPACARGDSNPYTVKY